MNRPSLTSILASHPAPALIAFVTGGFPSLEATALAIPALQRAGAAIVEVGFPFSDPIADGPVIAESMHRALRAGVTPRNVFDVVRAVRAGGTTVGLVAMVSDSIVTRFGPEAFVREAHASGFDGLIVPDIDLDAAEPLAGLTRVHGLSLSLLIAPTTNEVRIARIASLCRGFIYVLARVGITGESAQLDEPRLRQQIEIIRRHSDLPLAVGFGISQPEHVQAVARLANAAIIGSAIVRRMDQPDARAAAEAAAALLRELGGASK